MILIAADRDQQPLVCPCCSSPTVERSPQRLPSGASPPAGRVTLHCTVCGRSAIYTAAPREQSSPP